MNILMLDTRNVEQTKDVRMYTWRIYSSRPGYIAAQSWRSEDAWKNVGLYTLAIKGMRNVRIALDKGLFNRITIAWETVTTVTPMYPDIY